MMQKRRTGKTVDEFELIRRFFVRQGDDSSVLLGIGDDGAVIAPVAGRAIVAVVDTMVDGVHWPSALPPRDVGYRAVVVNVSDIAAMGARPRWMTLALTLAAADEAWLTGFAEGLFEAASEFGVILVGGDTTRGAQTTVSVQIIGDVDPKYVLKRSGAAPGDRIYVTGTPGDAAAGLSILKDRDGNADNDDQDRRYLVDRFAHPSARVALATSIAPLATAAIDLSDGLFADTQKLLDASRSGGYIDVGDLPLSPQLQRLFDESHALECALGGGDDYELCFTADEDHEAEILRLAKRHAVRVTRVGAVEAGTGLRCMKDGERIAFADEGYRHFQ